MSDLCPMCDGCGSRDTVDGRGQVCDYCRNTGRACLDHLVDDVGPTKGDDQ